VLAVLDESTPEDSGGIYYVIGAAVLLSGPEEVRSELSDLINDPGRLRPFHWHREGASARERMMRCLAEIGAVAHICVHYPTGRRKQEQARASGLTELIPLLVSEGVDELLIESRGDRGDNRDRRVIVGTLQDLGEPGAFVYGWRKKTEVLLWPADAVCGAVREYVLGENDTYYEELRNLGVIAEPIYIKS